jgi:hypothetical protein
LAAKSRIQCRGWSISEFRNKSYAENDDRFEMEGGGGEHRNREIRDRPATAASGKTMIK